MASSPRLHLFLSPVERLQETVVQCILLSSHKAYCDPATFSAAPLCIYALRNALQLIDRYPEEET
ncbi:hypothetical protein BDV98DRAFT_260635 [Pterulicium gracile]|uniref:Uncharacterized protein n=1 Tax=Pterulicium gracile TaxID=1884261 RepID=A0A5C3QH37_9AGAR|nr:hypothetical protein BDV98DRAFT_260635 [Pterula gracilis]